MKSLIALTIIGLICVTAVAQNNDPVVTLRDQIEAAVEPEDRIRLQLKLADHLVSTGHRTEALKELDAIAQSGAFDPPGFYNLGNSYARLGESDAAIAAYREAIGQRNGNYSRAYNNLGVVLLREGRWEEAYEALIAALKIESFRYAEASYNLGRVYAARGQHDLAAREWRRALQIDPKHDAAAQALARGNTDETIVVVREAPKAAPIPRPKSASIRGPRALALDQASFEYMQKARNASERGKMLEAVENFQQVLTRQGGYFPPANLELSYALLSLKRYDEALGNLIEVTRRDGTRYPISYFHLARTYEMKGDLKNAEAAFAQAIGAYVPTNNQFLLDLARVREKQGDFKGSLDALERYIATMQERGQKPAWSDQRLAELRSKIK
ncbi:MAG TPA: tetratricopeptide repeat protein [Pyrinomonadaceae bacterium]|nr:tetratricopeptide repeat protein [Pyrinomonadaceae bacterium]